MTRSIINAPTLPLACSLDANNLTNYDKDMSGLLKLVEILPQTKIESLRCAPAPKCSLLCQRPLTLDSHHPRPTHGSLGSNQLCGLNYRGEGTYPAEGITKLCEALKGSAVTSLECAAAPRVFAFASAPADTHLSPSWPHSWQLAQQQALRPRLVQPWYLHR